MKVLFEVVSEDAADILIQLAGACDRSGVSWGCFFTGAGVLSLSREEVPRALETAVTAISCEVSWGTVHGRAFVPCSIRQPDQ